jgi:hypothetical protein
MLFSPSLISLQLHNLFEKKKTLLGDPANTKIYAYNTKETYLVFD